MSNPDFLRSPENACEPDCRNEGYALHTESGFRPYVLSDHHAGIAQLTLHSGVPEDIRIQFETTKNLCLYSWFVYRFFPVAHHHAFTVLELALRERFEKEVKASDRSGRKRRPMLKELLAYAIKSGNLKNENFAIWRRTTELRARERARTELIEKMHKEGLKEAYFDEENIEIKDIDRAHDVLQILVDTFPYLRNEYAHGSKMLHNMALGGVRLISEIINQIYPNLE